MLRVVATIPEQTVAVIAIYIREAAIITVISIQIHHQAQEVTVLLTARVDRRPIIAVKVHHQHRRVFQEPQNQRQNQVTGIHYDNDDYDWDRYYSDSDYAAGVDDAMENVYLQPRFDYLLILAEVFWLICFYHTGLFQLCIGTGYLPFTFIGFSH